MNPERLLTILDKPKHSQTALERSLAIREHTGARLQLASFCWSPLATKGSGIDTAQRNAIRRSVIAEREEWLGGLTTDLELSDDQCQSEVVWTDDIAEWVAAESEKGSSMVVKSAHPSKTLLHTPLDWTLLNTVQVPMLFVSTRPDRRPAKQSRVVLAAVDLRHTDSVHRRLNRRVLAAAANVAQIRGAMLHCVCALEISTVLRDLDVIDVKKVKHKLLKRSKDELEQLLEPYQVAKSRRHFPVGKVGLTVSQAARKLKAELLVVGTHARRSRARLGLGNSAQRILSRAVCDVLAVSP